MTIYFGRLLLYRRAVQVFRKTKSTESRLKFSALSRSATLTIYRISLRILRGLLNSSSPLIYRIICQRAIMLTDNIFIVWCKGTSKSTDSQSL